MRMLLFSTLFAVTALAGPESIVPDKTVTPLVDIFASAKVLDDEKVEVRVSTFNKEGEIFRGKDRFIMSPKEYDRARKLSGAVYRMIPTEASLGDDGMTYQGTAFHIGHNLVLTNQHVLSPDRSNSTECKGFQLQDNASSVTFRCKKVHYCNVEEDVCLIEMDAGKQCLNFLCSKSQKVELKDGPAINLKADPVMTRENMDSMVMTCIGNTMGLGIHYSQGRGLRLSGERVFFFAPLRTGNSGGPLIGEDDLAWGVVKQESKVKVGNDAYNVAAAMDKVIALMKEQVVDKVVLEKFLNSVKK